MDIIYGNKKNSLYISVPPRIDVDLSSGDIITREGQTVTLTCNVSGIPPPVVHWYRRPLDQPIEKQKESKKPVWFQIFTTVALLPFDFSTLAFSAINVLQLSTHTFVNVLRKLYTISKVKSHIITK